MRAILSMDNVQIEITTACRNRCSNCSRFVGYKEPWFMEFGFFKKAVDSMAGYPKIIGIMGGEPLLHPEFDRICAYLREKFSPAKLGLWTTLPEGYEHYREDICKTFKHVFINDHTRPDIYHHPSLVAVDEVITDTPLMRHAIDNCWAQMCWCASINPRGAWFCEIAASMAMLFEDNEGWPVEPGWWNRIPIDFREQVEMYCHMCGYPALLTRRSSIEEIDDISPKNYERVKDFKKIKAGKYKIHNCCEDYKTNRETPMAAYKDTDYRNRIAKRYGMFLVVNEIGYWSPYLIGDKNSVYKRLQWQVPLAGQASQFTPGQGR